MAQSGHRKTTRGMTRFRAMSVLVLTAACLSCLGQKPAGTPPGSTAGKEPPAGTGSFGWHLLHSWRTPVYLGRRQLGAGGQGNAVALSMRSGPLTG